MKVDVKTLEAKAAGDVELNEAVFGLEPRADILHRVVTWQLEKRRGTARGARERSDVARTGKKFGRQKGGGVARHGDRRAPIFVGGGKAHGPRVRDFNPSLNKKIRALGLKMALSSKQDQHSVRLDNLVPRQDRVPVGPAPGWAGRRCSWLAMHQRSSPGFFQPRDQRARRWRERQALRADTLVLTRAPWKLEALQWLELTPTVTSPLRRGSLRTSRSDAAFENNAVVFKVARMLPSLNQGRCRGALWRQGKGVSTLVQKGKTKRWKGKLRAATKGDRHAGRGQSIDVTHDLREDGRGTQAL
jgi:hypothetical protein